MCGIAEFCLDPFYRTIKGFEILIEKEFCSFGHKFAERCGHSLEPNTEKEVSPIFTLFMDCIWQVTQQFPTSVEFNTKFLVDICDQSFACRFGTFLFNSERERIEHGVHNNTISVWSYLNSHRADYINPLYSPNDFNVLYPSVRMRDILLWTEFYLRGDPTRNSNAASINFQILQINTFFLKANINQFVFSLLRQNDKLGNKVSQLSEAIQKEKENK